MKMPMAGVSFKLFPFRRIQIHGISIVCSICLQELVGRNVVLVRRLGKIAFLQDLINISLTSVYSCIVVLNHRLAQFYNFNFCLALQSIDLKSFYLTMEITI